MNSFLFRIRPGTAADLSGLCRLTDEVYQALENKAQFNWPPETTPAELAVLRVLLLESDGVILGFIGFRELSEAFEISLLATAPASRRRGIQTKLLESLQELAAMHSKPVWLEVHEHNGEARALYARLGFFDVRVRPRYYGDGGDARVMSWPAEKAGC